MSRMFNTARIPQQHCDTLSPKPSSDSENARKVLVMIDDWMYAVEVYAADMSPLQPAELERRLLEAVKDVDTRSRAGERPVPVGILSSDNRDTWATVSQCILTKERRHPKQPRRTTIT